MAVNMEEKEITKCRGASDRFSAWRQSLCYATGLVLGNIAKSSLNTPWVFKMSMCKASRILLA